MGFLSRLFGNPHPSSQWQAAPGLKITLDLGPPALCGIRLGDPTDRIAQLGPPDKIHAELDQCETYVYARHGFIIEAVDRSVDSWIIFFDPTGEPDAMEPFRGTISHNGQPARLDQFTTIDDFCRRFGEPYWNDVDGEENLLFYEYGRVEWQAEFEHGRLAVLNFVSPPHLSDAKQRAAYKIDKPWPPCQAPSPRQ